MSLNSYPNIPKNSNVTWTSVSLESLAYVLEGVTVIDGVAEVVTLAEDVVEVVGVRLGDPDTEAVDDSETDAVTELVPEMLSEGVGDADVVPETVAVTDTDVDGDTGEGLGLSEPDRLGEADTVTVAVIDSETDDDTDPVALGEKEGVLEPDSDSEGVREGVLEADGVREDETDLDDVLEGDSVIDADSEFDADGDEPNDDDGLLEVSEGDALSDREGVGVTVGNDVPERETDTVTVIEGVPEGVTVELPEVVLEIETDGETEGVKEIDDVMLLEGVAVGEMVREVVGNEVEVMDGVLEFDGLQTDNILVDSVVVVRETPSDGLKI